MNYFDLYDQAVQPGSARDQSQHEIVLNETAQSISAALATALENLLGPQIDFSYLTMPLAFLAIYQVAPGRLEAPGHQIQLKSFPSYKGLAAISPGDETHALLVSLMESAEPEAMARDLLDDLGSAPAQNGSQSSSARIGKAKASKVGICFGVSFIERCRFQLRLPGKLRFVRGRSLPQARLDGALRLELLNHAVSHFPLDRRLRSVVAYLILTMPTFMLEGFSMYKAAADKLASRLKGLVIGTEFQRKPIVAMLIAVMKTADKPVTGIQHGGGYRQTDPNWWERAERYLCDSYRTWGYQFDPEEQPLPSIKLSRQAIQAKGGGDGKSYTGLELRILLAIPYISEELECSLYSPPYQLQVAAVESSLAILGPLLELDCKLTIRLHPKNKGASFIEALSVAGHPNVQYSAGTRGSIAEDAVNYTTLVFSSPQATGIAECLASGSQFYVAASPEYFWVREEAADQYREMNRCGIWLTRFDEVEELMQRGFSNMTHRQQVFRHSFARSFACHSDNYFADWSKMLKNV
jgi:putative transferase (TIGR04331 family)